MLKIKSQRKKPIILNIPFEKNSWQTAAARTFPSSIVSHVALFLLTGHSSISCMATSYSPSRSCSRLLHRRHTLRYCYCYRCWSSSIVVSDDMLNIFREPYTSTPRSHGKGQGAAWNTTQAAMCLSFCEQCGSPPHANGIEWLIGIIHTAFWPTKRDIKLARSRRKAFLRKINSFPTANFSLSFNVENVFVLVHIW